MDHAEVRERLELAAVEPGELDRLAAGDTPDAAAVAGHLAGCRACAEEAHRLSNVAPLIREAARSVPPDALRERTLTLVRAVGRPRGAASVPSPVAASGAASVAPPDITPSPHRRAPRWPAAIAAVVALAVLAGGGIYAVGVVQQHQSELAALAELNTATLRVSALPDATRVELAGGAGSGDPAVGTLLFSPATTELVVSAPSLVEPPAGQRYVCWLTRPDGTRARMGYMDFGGGLAYWTGWDAKLHDVGPETMFGITLVGADGRPIDGDALSGTLDRG